MRSGLKNHRRHQRTEARINGTKAGRFAADVLEGLSLDQPQETVDQPEKTLYERIVEVQGSAIAVEVLEDGQWRTTLHPSEAAAEWFMQHSENDTRRSER